MFILRFFVLGFFVWWGVAMGQIPSDEVNAIGSIIIFSLLITVPWLYMLPTYEAYKLKQSNISSIAILNLFLGWTLLGWVVAAVWAFKKTEPEKLMDESSKNEAAVSFAQDTKVCPFCAEEIKLKALICKHCGKEQPEMTLVGPHERKS